LIVAWSSSYRDPASLLVCGKFPLPSPLQSLSFAPLLFLSGLRNVRAFPPPKNLVFSECSSQALSPVPCFHADFFRGVFPSFPSDTYVPFYASRPQESNLQSPPSNRYGRLLLLVPFLSNRPPPPYLFLTPRPPTFASRRPCPPFFQRRHSIVFCITFSAATRPRSHRYPEGRGFYPHFGRGDNPPVNYCFGKQKKCSPPRSRIPPPDLGAFIIV